MTKIAGRPVTTLSIAIITVLATVLALAMGAGSALAHSSTSALLPRHTTSTSLSLIGASEAGLAVQQGAVLTNTSMVGAVLTGVEGTRLTPWPALKQTAGDPARAHVLTVAGDTLAWYQKRSAVAPTGRICIERTCSPGRM